MSRKEASNTFTDGLIKDLNPINTPNTVLTDCLNGTLITYDGNEYSLQNEKGNYPLKNCKLKPNYIPVGIKEYGDILYIVSYNPLDEHVEIGSYPSPETIHDADDLDDLEQDVNSTLNGTSSGTRVNHSYIVENRQPLYIFYGASEYGPNEYKLNPGDLYKISNTVTNLSAFEELKYYVFDDNRRSYDITDKVNDFSQHKDENGFAHVNWDIPGWIAVQPRFAEILDFNINVKKIIVPSYGNGTIKMSLNFQLSTEDPLYLKNIGTAMENLRVNVSVYAHGKNPSDDTEVIDTITLGNVIDVKNGNLVFYSNDFSINSLNWVASKYESLTITAEPFIYTNGIYVDYDKFSKTVVFNLNQKGLVSDFRIGNGHWWYNTDASENKFSLMFDTRGLANSSVLDQDVYLYYSIKKLDGTAVIDNAGQPYTNILCEDWNLIGETNLEFPLKEFTEANYTASHNYFFPEEFYIIKFDFYDTPTISQGQEALREGITKFISATELMNNQQVALYDTVPFDAWMGKYIQAIKDKKITITKDNNGSIVIENPYIDNNEVLNNWEYGNGGSKKYSTLVPNDVYEDLEMSQGFNIICNASCTVSVQYGTNAKLLTGPMWLELNSTSYAVFNSRTFDSGKKTFAPYTGILNNNNSLAANLTGTAQKLIPYRLSPISSDQVRVWEYEWKELKQITLDTQAYAGFDSEGDLLEERQGKWRLYIDAIPEAGITKYYKFKEMRGSSIHEYIDNTEFLSPMTSLFSKYDIVFLKFAVAQLLGTYNDTYDGLTLYSSSRTFIDKKASYPAEYVYFAAVPRTSTSIALLPIIANDEGEAKDRFITFVQKLHKLECNPETIKEGCFYEALEGTEQISNNISFSLDGKIVFGSVSYNNLNLLSAADRSSLVSSLTEVNTSNLTKIAETDIVKIEDCPLTKIDEVAESSLDFSSKDTQINVLKAKIENVTTQSRSQLATYGSDDVIQRGDAYANEYFEKVSGSIGGVMLDLLNNQSFIGSSQLYVNMHRTTYSLRGQLTKCVGYISSSNQYDI